MGRYIEMLQRTYKFSVSWEIKDVVPRLTLFFSFE
jgi:hypothetical protein